MSAPNDGGPVFPSTAYAVNPAGFPCEIREPGMSLRDWFAGQALAGLLANTDREGRISEFTADAYAYAAAMLAARGGR